MRLQRAGRRALAVAHHGRQHDGAVDLAALGLLGGRRRRLQHAQQLRIGLWLAAGLGAHILEQPAEISRHIGAQPPEVDIGGLQDQRRFLILGERQQQVLERHGAVRLLARKAVRPLQAFTQVGRHRDRFEVVRNRMRHQPPP